MTIDLNCDLGETSVLHHSGQDAQIMPWITSANIACGFHAGDPLTIEKTILLALKHGVSIGAHPGYPDKEGFGRNEMNLLPEELRASILYQVGAMKSMAEALGGRLRHVKPHGALYNSAVIHAGTARIIARAIFEIDPSLILYGLSGSELIRAAEETGLTFASEVFADRAYNDDGTLVSRRLVGAVLTDAQLVIDRALQMASEKKVETVSGRVIPLKADTICIHGDNAQSAEFARKLNEAFNKNGIHLCPPQNLRI